MGILSDRQIIELVKSNELTIRPFDQKLVQPATYDLCLGMKILASPLGEDILGKVVDLTPDNPDYQIQPGQMVGVISLERIELPQDMCGRFGIRSVFARKGINAFGGLQLDPGFKGHLILNLINVGPEPVTITLNEPLFSVEFSRLEQVVEKPYSGPYQDQNDFPADQYNFILKAKTTSLAEIPTLRRSVARLNVLLEEFGEKLPDPDEGLELKPEIETKLVESSKLPRESLISSSELRRRLEL